MGFQSLVAGRCLDEEQTARYVEGVLSAPEREIADAHLSDCRSCLATIGVVARALRQSSSELVAPLPSGPAIPSSGRRLSPRSSVGRYLVLSPVGEGGMGIVYAAYDPELHRRVALKLMRPPRGGQASPGDSVRLMREARLMAKLAHPNVVAVHDVGLFEDQVFLAMEFVEGCTLRAWAAERRSLAEIIEVVLQAGEGLAAAHRAGLVHRDFKPDNVLVGRDGRVRVTDFGLARAEAGAAAVDVPFVLPAGLAGTTTERGAVLGTPAYMAPEQKAGQPADAASDQFAFCVTAYEALTGERPTVAGNLLRFEVRDAGRRSRLPPRVRAELLRGLSLSPSSRHPDMDRLLARLRRAPRARRRQMMAVAGALLTLSAGFGVKSAVARANAASQMCSGAEHKLDGVWGDAQKLSLSRAFAATGAPFAGDAFQRASELLDVYAAGWVAEYTETCAATRVRGEQSEEVMTARMECLDGRLRELSTLTSSLASPDRDRVALAPAAVGRLSAPADCSEGGKLPLPASPELRRAIKESRDALAVAKGQLAAGRIDDSLAGTTALVQKLAAIAYRPLDAEVMGLHASAQEEHGDLRAAQASWMKAIDAAEAGRHDALAAEAWSRVLALSAHLSQFDDAERARLRAHAAFERIGKTGKVSYMLPHSEATLAEEQGRYADADAFLRQGLAAREKMSGPRNLESASMLVSLGLVLNSQDNRPEALEAYAKSAAIYEELLGPSHPSLADALHGIGYTYLRQARYAEAKAILGRALAIREGAFGSESPRLVESLRYMAGVLIESGDARAAIPFLERALRLTESLGPEARASLLQNIGVAHQLHDRPKARAYLEQALATRIEALGKDHPKVAMNLVVVGDMDFADRRLDAARKKYLEALGILERTLGKEHSRVAGPLVALAHLYVWDKRFDLALAAGERALTLRSKGASTPAELAQAQFVVARLRLMVKHDRAGAVALAEQAQQNYKLDSHARYGGLAAVETWLAQHRPK